MSSGLHQRFRDGAAGRDDHDAVAEPAGADQDELAGADERPREAPSRLKAAAPSWIIAKMTTRASASQRVKA
ncbi:hypothetical protein [Nocardioides dokdonensis]|uniref:hypothetical protein n=1 Tax=Nocardioides dokdonensis TaxID=450734 RepID=UPI001471F616|nr:hypothetical protein [Nocardioides dokdonensis]